MSKCDDIKRFFSACLRLDMRIQARAEERQRYWELATKITPTYTGMPSTSDTTSKVESGAIKLAQLEQEIDVEINDLVEFRRLAKRVIEQLTDYRHRDLLTLRYFNGYTWEQIMERMSYENTQVWRIHGYALAAAREVIREITAVDPQAMALYQKTQSRPHDGMERNVPPVI